MRWMAGLVLVVALAGCTASDPPSTPPPTGFTQPGTAPAMTSGAAQPTARPVARRITLRRQGGLAGVDQRIVIESGGQWTYTDGRANRSETGRLTQGQWTLLSELATNPAVRAEGTGGTPPAGCADGFNYVLTVDELSVDRYDCGQDDQPTVVEIITFITDSTPM